jgi:hypothetical protein
MNNPATLPIVISHDGYETHNLRALLLKAAWLAIGENNVEDKEGRVLSPDFETYIYKEKRESLSVHEGSICVQIPDSVDALNDITACRLIGIESELLRGICYAIAMGCAAGGTKALIDLLKAWVEERKGRRIKIKQGEVEIEIQGGMSQKRIKEMVDMFEAKFGKSRIIQP